MAPILLNCVGNEYIKLVFGEFEFNQKPIVSFVLKLLCYPPQTTSPSEKSLPGHHGGGYSLPLQLEHQDSQPSRNVWRH